MEGGSGAWPPVVGADSKLGFIWLLNDGGALWRYNPSSRMWAWIAGTQSGSRPVYNSMGVANTTSTPGYRISTRSLLVDPRSRIWLYGGGYYGNGADLWM
jgi:hypothetical protein